MLWGKVGATLQGCLINYWHRQGDAISLEV
jgi:hypothetical protein